MGKEKILQRMSQVEGQKNPKERERKKKGRRGKEERMEGREEKLCHEGQAVPDFLYRGKTTLAEAGKLEKSPC